MLDFVTEAGADFAVTLVAGSGSTCTGTSLCTLEDGDGVTVVVDFAAGV